MRKKKESPAAKDAATGAPQDAKRGPVHTIRIGEVSASVWSREHVVQGQPRTFYSATFERSYKTRDGAWGYSRSFDPDSFGHLISVIQKADEHITGLSNQ